MYAIVAAVDTKWGIGRDGKIPWTQPQDTEWFRHLTRDAPPLTTNVVIMGRRTWESLSKPLFGRLNIVISAGNIDGVVTFRTFEDAIVYAHRQPSTHHVFAVGGTKIYEAAMRHPAFSICLLSAINGDYQCDTFFPHALLSRYTNQGASKTLGTLTCPWFVDLYVDTDAIATDLDYMGLVSRVLDGKLRPNRTGTDTLAVFGDRIRVPLTWRGHPTVPLLSTKLVPVKAVWTELLWFLSGATNTDFLTANGVRIWDGNTSREYLDSRGLTKYRVGEVGPAYPFQWRHFGAEYIPECDRTNKLTGGVDQISRVLDCIRVDPYSRRHLLSSWNPLQESLMALPPCHYAAQWYVDEGTLSCQMNMRSCDVALGLPFNVASYALLTHVFCKLTSLVPGTLTIVTGDTHIYSNHMDGMREQLKRIPRGPAILRWTHEFSQLDQLTVDTVSVTGYCPHKKITMPMAV